MKKSFQCNDFKNSNFGSTYLPFRRVCYKIGPMKIKKVFFIVAPIFFIVFVLLLVKIFLLQKRINTAALQKFVVVEDSLFDRYFQDTEFESDLNFISKKDFTSLDCNDKSESISAGVVAIISVQKNIAISEVPVDDDLTRYYVLAKKNYFPSIREDFSGDVRTNDPTLSVNLTDSENLPNGNRALPVDGKYAGEDGYLLDEVEYACCSVLLPVKNQELFSVCDKVFANKKTDEPKTIFLSSVGDMMVARGIQEILMQDEDGLEKVFGKTLPILQNSDITIGNLEGVVTESNKNAIKTYVFKFHKPVLEALKKAGFNYFMQTNNHCYDYGEQGFKETLEALKEYNIPTSGAGFNEDEARRFYHVKVNGTDFSIISCGAYPVERSGFNGQTMATATKDRAGILWYDEQLFEDIKKEKESGYFVIVNVHGGEEYNRRPTKSQREIYERFVDSGADVVFGSHPHVLQPTEWYNNKLIVYSMGNFLFNEMENMASYGALETEVVRLGIAGNKVVYAEIYPAKINGKSVDLVTK